MLTHEDSRSLYITHIGRSLSITDIVEAIVHIYLICFIWSSEVVRVKWIVTLKNLTAIVNTSCVVTRTVIVGVVSTVSSHSLLTARSHRFCCVRHIPLIASLIVPLQIGIWNGLVRFTVIQFPHLALAVVLSSLVLLSSCLVGWKGLCACRALIFVIVAIPIIASDRVLNNGRE